MGLIPIATYSSARTDDLRSITRLPEIANVSRTRRGRCTDDELALEPTYMSDREVSLRAQVHLEHRPTIESGLT